MHQAAFGGIVLTCDSNGGSGGTPTPKIAVAGSGVLLIAGGLSVALGVLPVIGLILILVFLLPVSFVMHDFWAVPEEEKMNERSTS